MVSDDMLSSQDSLVRELRHWKNHLAEQPELLSKPRPELHCQCQGRAAAYRPSTGTGSPCGCSPRSPVWRNLSIKSESAMHAVSDKQRRAANQSWDTIKADVAINNMLLFALMQGRKQASTAIPAPQNACPLPQITCIDRKFTGKDKSVLEAGLGHHNALFTTLATEHNSLKNLCSLFLQKRHQLLTWMYGSDILQLGSRSEYHTTRTLETNRVPKLP
eukprot:scaffold4012_cov20-Tisochrysis_lutea.AAC.2